MSPTPRHRFAVVTNIPTPYRTTFFGEVARVCEDEGDTFKVFYCAQNESSRNWPFDPARMEHAFEILPGLHIRLGNATHHINPSVIVRLAAYRPDVVLCAGSWHMAATVLASLRSIAGRSRTVFWSEGHAEAVRHTQGVIPWLRRKALGLHYAYAVPNRRSAEWIRAEAGEQSRIILLPNSVDGAFFTRRGPDERRGARSELGLALDGTIIVQVSQLTVRKGVIPLARAFCGLPDGMNQTARLVFVGAGPQDAELRKIADASGRVFLAGSLGIDGVRRWLMAANWFALNTLLDPNPLSPIEASFARLPLLMTTRAGNFEELLIEGVTGYGIPEPADPSAALTQALTTPADRAARMGEAAFAVADRNFDLSRIASDLVGNLSRLAER